jgi:RNA polymerase sigma factor (sigma-70 family)
MTSRGSVSAWIGQLKAGEDAALAKLHERYWPRLVSLARRKLLGTPRRAADEEDVAQEAFWDFYRSLQAGRIPRLSNRHDLMALLTHLVACRGANQIKREVGVLKRGAGRLCDEAALDGARQGGLRDAPAAGHSPLEQALLHDCYRRYVDGLSDNLREFAELYLAGCTHKEIAARLGCVERTVERKMALILRKWQEMAVESLNEPG